MHQIKSFSLRNQRSILFAVLAILSAIFFLWKLGQSAFVDYDEATYAQVIKEMLSSGHFLSLTYFGSHWFEKPPLYFWMAALCAKIFGLNEFALRLPAALAGIGTVLLVWAIGLELSKKDWIAFASGLVLLTTTVFVEAGRQVRMDVPVTFFIILGFYCFIRGIEKPKWNAGIAISAALAVLTKSVIGFFIFPIVLLFSIFNHSWGWLTDRYFWLGTACSLVIAVPWHIYESILFGRAFWGAYFFYHVVDRFEVNIVGGTLPPTIYFTLLSQYVALWSIVFLALSAVLSVNVLSDKANYRKHLAALSYLSIVIFILTVFSIAETKLFTYLDPLFPFAALFIALMAGFIYERLGNSVYKKAAIGVFSLLICIGLWQTIQFTFFTSIDPYDQLQAEDEKPIGLSIGSYPSSYGAYVYDLSYLSTLDFYSGRQVRYFPDPPPVGSYLLAVPTELIRNGTIPQSYLDSAKVLYAGIALTLVAYPQTVTP